VRFFFCLNFSYDGCCNSDGNGKPAVCDGLAAARGLAVDVATRGAGFRRGEGIAQIKKDTPVNVFIVLY